MTTEEKLAQADRTIGDMNEDLTMLARRIEELEAAKEWAWVVTEDVPHDSFYILRVFGTEAAAYAFADSAPVRSPDSIVDVKKMRFQ